MELEVQQILNKLTTEQKVSLCSGADFWHTVGYEDLLPSVLMTDGPHGLRKEIQKSKGVNIMGASEVSTCFPTAVTLASSWDRQIVRDVALAISNEAHLQGVQTVLGPGTNIKRSPLCGRNFEYFSEDPYLSGELATNYIESMQSNNVGCSLKHFCANNQEYNRFSIDAIVDERTLREIYLPAFEKAVKKAQPYQVMCSYNKLNGTYLADNKRMLTDILREEWGFKGIVVSDWGAVNNRVDGIKAGLDLEMPGSNGINNKFIYKALDDGTLTIDDLDKVVVRLIEYALKCDKDKIENFDYDYKTSHEVAKYASENSAVLLKNEENILPLNKEENIALIGALAKESRYQGAGSSKIIPQNLVSIYDAFVRNNAKFEYADGYTIKDETDAKLTENALSLAKNADKVVLVLGLTNDFEGEGYDRDHIYLPNNQIELLHNLFKVNQNIVVVLETGAVVSMKKWISEPKAILNMYLGGEAVGEATYDLLYGIANPSGKLAETFPVSLDNYIVSKYFPMGPINVQYRESIFVGYRYYDTAKVDVQFPFGFGLSYTTFDYSNLNVTLGEDGKSATVTFDITNTGTRRGKEVAEVYIKQFDSVIFKADKELKGFEKVDLMPNETKTVTIELDERAFSYYNVNIKDWSIEKGNYQILVGASSRDIKLTYDFSLEGDGVEPIDYRDSANCYYNIDKVDEIPVNEFAVLYGEEIPDGTPNKKGQYHLNSTLGEVTDSWFGNLLRRVMLFGAKIISKGTENETMVLKSLPLMPFRNFVQFSGGMLTHESANGIVKMVNGHFFKGLAQVLRGFGKKYR